MGSHEVSVGEDPEGCTEHDAKEPGALQSWDVSDPRTTARGLVLVSSSLGRQFHRRMLEQASNGSLACRFPQMAPPLPDFALALKPDEYRLPPPDPSWDEEDQRWA